MKSLTPCVLIVFLLVLGGCSGTQVYDYKSGGSYALAPDWRTLEANPTIDSRADKSAAESSAKPKTKFKMARLNPLSTFSADVDTASYSNVRRYLKDASLPPADLVRVEEMLNYFNYDLPAPDGDNPFSVTTEVSNCPWSDETKLMRVAIKTQDIEKGELPPRNLVFLLDVSGSMESPDKLPLLKRSLRKLVENLDDSDTVSIVVYSGNSGVALEPTSGDQKIQIMESIYQLSAGGSTHGSAGIQLAYELAEKTKQDSSINRVILATDGDFNVGISTQAELTELIENKRKSGIFLSVLGFGYEGNDAVMEALADNGNGNYASIDSLSEAEKVLVEQAGGTLVTVAKDVKFQVAFDPKQVESYRLIGYDNRRLGARDFDDDSKDAGDVGAGHAVTALYELNLKKKDPDINLLEKSNLIDSKQLATVKIRYKHPEAHESNLMERKVEWDSQDISASSPDHQWASAVAAFALKLKGGINEDQIETKNISSLLQAKMAMDPDTYHTEFCQLVRQAEPLLR